jgi:hypothetical protein
MISIPPHSTLAALKAEATDYTKADTLATAKLDIAQFKHNLRIEVDERKEKAHSAVAPPTTSVSQSKGKSRQHNPVGCRSRAVSITSSCLPSLVPSLLPLPSTPVAQVVELLDTALLDTTPKGPSFPTPHHEAFTPIETALDMATEDKACAMYDTMVAALCLSVKDQLKAFSDAFDARLSTSFTAITSQLDALEANHIDAVIASTSCQPIWHGKVDTSNFQEYEEMDAEDYASHFPPPLLASTMMLLPEYAELQSHIDELFDSIHCQTVRIQGS